jgi:hypothetical protein
VVVSALSVGHQPRLLNEAESADDTPMTARHRRRRRQCWQADFTHYRLTRPDGRPGADCEILTWLDDCSRFAPSVTVHVCG